MLKICNTCNIPKPHTEFYSDPTQLSGLHPQCKICNNAYSKQYRDTHKEKMKQYKKAARMKDPIKYMLILVKARCKHLGNHIPFSILPEDVEYVTHCPILGIELNYFSEQSKRGMVVDNAASIDRIVPSLGYIPGNVMVVSWRANKLKSDITLEEMALFAQHYEQVVLKHNSFQLST